jgi:hypothetical protein
LSQAPAARSSSTDFNFDADTDLAGKQDTNIQKQEVLEELKEVEKAEKSEEPKLTLWQRMMKQLSIVSSIPTIIMGILKIVRTMPTDAKKMRTNLDTIKEGKQTFINQDATAKIPSAGLGISGDKVKLKSVRSNAMDEDQMRGWLIMYNTMSAVYLNDFFERSILPFSKELVKAFKVVERFFPSLQGYAGIVDQSFEIFSKAVRDLKVASQENIRLQYTQLTQSALAMGAN